MEAVQWPETNSQPSCKILPLSRALSSRKDRPAILMEKNQLMWWQPVLNSNLMTVIVAQSCHMLMFSEMRTERTFMWIFTARWKCSACLVWCWTRPPPVRHHLSLGAAVPWSKALNFTGTQRCCRWAWQLWGEQMMHRRWPVWTKRAVECEPTRKLTKTSTCNPQLTKQHKYFKACVCRM